MNTGSHTYLHDESIFVKYAHFIRKDNNWDKRTTRLRVLILISIFLCMLFFILKVFCQQYPLLNNQKKANITEPIFQSSCEDNRWLHKKSIFLYMTQNICSIYDHSRSKHYTLRMKRELTYHAPGTVHSTLCFDPLLIPKLLLCGRYQPHHG